MNLAPPPTPTTPTSHADHDDHADHADQVDCTLVLSFELRDFEVRYRRPSIEYINPVDDGLPERASQLRQQASSIFLLV